MAKTKSNVKFSPFPLSFVKHLETVTYGANSQGGYSTPKSCHFLVPILTVPAAKRSNF